MDALESLFAQLPAWLEVGTLGRLLLALGLGAAIGFEREMRGKPAGLRTIILIAVGAELFTEASIAAATLELTEATRSDPARIAAQIVTGIGFIGAGTILVHRGAVVGLTTAASLWVAAAVGMTVGLRAYVIAIGGTALVVGTLVVVGWIEHHLLPERTQSTLKVTLDEGVEEYGWVTERLAERDFFVIPLELSRTEAGLVMAFRVTGDREARDHLLEGLFDDPRVRSVSLE